VPTLRLVVQILFLRLAAGFAGLVSYAEAQNEAVGLNASMYSALNKLRTRLSLPVLAAGMSQSQMRDYIRRECRIELASEEKHWVDVRRWQIAGGTNGVLNTPSYGMLINAAGTSCTKVKVLESKCFSNQSILPIWQGDLAKNTKLTQNPGCQDLVAVASLFYKN
jgi:hypothetical protein